MPMKNAITWSAEILCRKPPKFTFLALEILIYVGLCSLAIPLQADELNELLNTGLAYAQALGYNFQRCHLILDDPLIFTKN